VQRTPKISRPDFAASRTNAETRYLAEIAKVLAQVRDLEQVIKGIHHELSLTEKRLIADYRAMGRDTRPVVRQLMAVLARRNREQATKGGAQ
jgi:hypothetical protein